MIFPLVSSFIFLSHFPASSRRDICPIIAKALRVHQTSRPCSLTMSMDSGRIAARTVADTVIPNEETRDGYH